MNGEVLSVPEAGVDELRRIVDAHGGRLIRDTPRAHARARQLTWEFPNGGQLAWREVHWVGECIVHAVGVDPALLAALPVARAEQLAAYLDAPEPFTRIRALRQLVAIGAPYAQVARGLAPMLASPMLAERQAVISALRLVTWPEVRDLLASRLPHEDVLAPQIRLMLG